jgi:biopolymer transport protein TolR
LSKLAEMAGGMDLGGGLKGGRKPLDAAINLVPFIDLMAVTISFLIYTAVWTQVGRLQVSGEGGLPHDSEPTTEVPIVLDVSLEHLRLSAGSAQADVLPIVRDSQGRLDLAALREKLRRLAAQLPEQKGITLRTDDAVRYDDVVRIIDECVGDGLPSVSLATG